jgi:hypothetical protein
LARPTPDGGFTSVPVKSKRPRRTKEQLKQPDAVPPRKNSVSFRVLQQRGRHERKIPWNAETEAVDAPYYTYIDVIAEKTDTIAQDASYVQRAFKAVSDTGLFAENGFSALVWWSDGCGKHFKCYEHLWHVSTLKTEFVSVRSCCPPSMNIAR